MEGPTISVREIPSGGPSTADKEDMKMEKICAEFRWTADDYIEVQKHFWKLSRQLRGYLSALFSLFMTAILFQMFPECLDELSEAGRTVIPPLVWLHFFVLYTLFLNLVREVGIRLALHLEAPPQETLYYQLGQHAIDMSSPLCDSRVKWSMFSKWQETENLFILLSRQNHFIIPKRTLHQESPALVRELLSSKVGPEGI